MAQQLEVRVEVGATPGKGATRECARECERERAFVGWCVRMCLRDVYLTIRVLI